MPELLTSETIECLDEIIELSVDWQLFQQDADAVNTLALQPHCDRAAASAIALARMRRVHEQSDFRPLALTELLVALAEKAQTSLAAVLAHFKLASLNSIEIETVPVIAKLLLAVGISRREAAAYSTISLLKNFGVPHEELAAQFRSIESGGEPLERCETTLAQITANSCTPAQSEMLRHLADALNIAWDKQEST